MANPKILADQIVVPGVLSWGLAADRPAASGSGVYYYETDTPGLYQDQGEWTAISSGGSSSVSENYNIDARVLALEIRAAQLELIIELLTEKRPSDIVSIADALSYIQKGE